MCKYIDMTDGYNAGHFKVKTVGFVSVNKKREIA